MTIIYLVRLIECKTWFVLSLFQYLKHIFKTLLLNDKLLDQSFLIYKLPPSTNYYQINEYLRSNLSYELANT